MPSSQSPAPSASRHVDDLYGLAHVLVGSENADTLVEQVYRRASEIPERNRPSNERAWLFRLMLRLRDESLDEDETTEQPSAQSSFHSDPFREEVAARLAERALPTAFASCSIRERFILALDAVHDPPDPELAEILDTTPADAQSTRNRARSALRASLRDILKGPERMLVDVALPEEALQSHLRSYLENQFESAPSPLASRVQRALEHARTDEDGPRAETSFSFFGRALSTPSWLSSRALIGLIIGLLILGAWIGVASYFDTSTSSPQSASIVEVSAKHTSDLTAKHGTSSRTDAAQYVRQTWNRTVSVPGVESASLVGVAHVQLSPDTTIPAFLYSEKDGPGRITVYAYNYALIDTVGDRITLPRRLRRKLAANRSLIDGKEENNAIVLWRQQDDLLVAVGPHLSADTLRPRIQL